MKYDDLAFFQIRRLLVRLKKDMPFQNLKIDYSRCRVPERYAWDKISTVENNSWVLLLGAWENTGEQVLEIKQINL